MNKQYEKGKAQAKKEFLEFLRRRQQVLSIYYNKVQNKSLMISLIIENELDELRQKIKELEKSGAKE